MKHWIFQGNPDTFDLDGYLRAVTEFKWSVRQKHLASEMQAGDEVFLWRSKGSSGKSAGVVAIATILGPPSMLMDDEAALPFWRDTGQTGVQLRVPLSIPQSPSVGKERFVHSEHLKEDPILKNLLILRLRNNTNYAITPEEALRLKTLYERVGVNWSREETIAVLWAYKETLDGEVSLRADSPVARIALLTGRSVNVAYNKLMNFRAINPDDQRPGINQLSAMDADVWNEFYDASSKSLKLLELDTAFAQAWESPTETIEAGPVYQDFGEAPNDDLNELRLFAIRVRRGQPHFRENLLVLYGNRCAVTGWGPCEVLEACHIDPHSRSGINHTDNGLLLRSDIHVLFDQRLLWIDPHTMRIRVDKSLNGTNYMQYDGQELRKRTNGTHPSSEYVARRISVIAKETL